MLTKRLAHNWCTLLDQGAQDNIRLGIPIAPHQHHTRPIGDEFANRVVGQRSEQGIRRELLQVEVGLGQRRRPAEVRVWFVLHSSMSALQLEAYIWMMYNISGMRLK